ncbi:redox-sensitive transcriptional activator SoxR [Kribbella sandramycini]|uniref:Redox-sensitive transcriptional activator SoxR n=1 Tax=Kribbella sandramycini TaxID=60450 RepID=A0A7Y4NYJ3_9ACTN|nr:redox-sensitive transcriptional activator SoxR [Kribbella sandramycini]MBB6569131.1 MerR family redox-sensitive transcriptional activator SoxR [Kribbella sandramycini]NOL41027.1 redox-sensitive transcriptional activator SoxR [Kribbella sandramycini]
MVDPTAELTIGQLAKRAGVTVTALHFYEERDLIHSRRTPGNQRRFPRHTLRRIAFIRVAQRVGIPLREIAEALATLPKDHAPTQADWETLSTSWQADLDLRIAQLTRLRNKLTDCIGCGCLSLDRCLLRNPNDHLGATPGPRRLWVDP